MVPRNQVKAAQQGDEAAFTTLITEYQPILYNTAWRLLRNEADVADVLQETILRAWQKLPQLREPRYFNTWLYRILINEVQRFRRNTTAEPLSETLPATAPPDQQALIAAIDQLPHELQEALVFYYYVGLKTKEIALVLDQPAATVRTHLRRARAQLKTLLTTEEGAVHHDQA
mgnify:CR=1 FL=1|jgi:RNA polymerase sigma-70 factor (ECF subfamily)